MTSKAGRSGVAKTGKAKVAVQRARIASGISRSGPAGATPAQQARVMTLWERDRKAAIEIKEAKAKDAQLDAAERAREMLRADEVRSYVLALAAGIRSELAAVRPGIDMLGLEPAVRDAVLAVWTKADASLRARIAAVPVPGAAP